jgi:putative outer membrane protein
MSASIGFGIPIINPYNNRSFLNVSAQWVRSTAKNYIQENVFRINVGLTFNELWFKKWKLE